MLHGVKSLLATTVHNKWSACEGTQDTASTAVASRHYEYRAGRQHQTATAAQFLLSPLHCTPFMDQVLVLIDFVPKALLHPAERYTRHFPSLQEQSRADQNCCCLADTSGPALRQITASQPVSL
jgi:hypothetical protein